MIGAANYKRFENWTEQCLAKGKLSFSLSELKNVFNKDTAITIKFALNRLVHKQKIVSIFKGYYIIIPPQYLSKGILPPHIFLDGLMKFLERKYYVGLLNAAAFHGASHQQPQEYFVITEYPVLRSTKRKGMKINYTSTRQMPPEALTEKKKTEAGYITVSNPLLTAIDLITYEKKIGGLNRAATVINELLESIKTKDVNEALVNYASATSLQRLGFLCDEALNRKDLADRILTLCRKLGINFYTIGLKASGRKSQDPVNEKWKLILNTEIEID